MWVGDTVKSLADKKRPRSVIPVTDGLGGLAVLTIAWLVGFVAGIPASVYAPLLLLAVSLPMLLIELHRSRPSVPASSALNASPFLWALCFTAASAPFALMHFIGTTIDRWVIGWGVALIGFALRWAVEFLLHGPTSLGGFPAALATAKHRVEWTDVRCWSLKAIFIPIYGLSLFGLAQLALYNPLTAPKDLLLLLLTYAYTIDLAFGLAGYIFASERLGLGIRSTQPDLFGWVVCLLCYGPVFNHWLGFASVLHAEITWPTLIDSARSQVGAAVLLVSLPIYISATVVFGLRFSNLSNRGIITAGPYALMKHPAYFAHVVNACALVLLMIPLTGGTLLVLVALTILYRFRAITEEAHLNEDQSYLAYSDWIARHGLWANAKSAFWRQMPGFRII